VGLILGSCVGLLVLGMVREVEYLAFRFYFQVQFLGFVHVLVQY
jgi:hypothetical protein